MRILNGMYLDFRPASPVLIEINKNDWSYARIATTGNGGLLIGSPRCFELQLTTWDQGFCWYQRQGATWRRQNGDIGLPLAYLFMQGRLGPIVGEFLKRNVPFHILLATAKYSFLQSLLLSLVSRNRYASDLLMSTPNLLWLIIDKMNQHNTSIQAVAPVFTKRQTDLVRLFGGVGTSAEIKFLRKIQLLNGTSRELHIIQSAIKQPDLIRNMHHLHEIPVYLLEFCIKNRILPNVHLMEEIAAVASLLDRKEKNTEYTTLSEIVTDCRHLGNSLCHPHIEESLNACSSIERLRALHDRWQVENQEYLLYKGMRHVVFPQPPIPGNRFIEPITTPKELIHEAAVMHHCVSSYMDAVTNGNSYIYKLLEPERATFELVRCDDHWRLGQVKKKCNGEPSEETTLAIKKWLEP